LRPVGWAAAVVALFVTYVRAVGKGVGVPGLFQGPMAKSHRMFLLTVACVYAAAAPRGWQPQVRLPWCGCLVSTLGVALMVVVAGGLLTAVRRLGRLARALRGASEAGGKA
jgi:hypothetical protein